MIDIDSWYEFNNNLFKDYIECINDEERVNILSKNGGNILNNIGMKMLLNVLSIKNKNGENTKSLSKVNNYLKNLMVKDKNFMIRSFYITTTELEKVRAYQICVEW